MSRKFEEIDWRETPIGVISLRRRLDPSLQIDVYEVKLDDEFLMSSLFTVAEIELARLGLAAVAAEDLDVLVGGLGLGYTARAALEDGRVRSLEVMEGLGEVIEWHQRELLPASAPLASDGRTRLVHADFFAWVEQPASGAASADRRHHAILLDIDHSPSHVLHASHRPFYEPAGLRSLAERLHPGGAFALWSDDPPEEGFTAALREVFATAEAHVVPFTNPYTGGAAANTVYVARRGE